MTTTRISRRLNASRSKVYGALLDGRAVATWMVPDGMTSQVHEFETADPGMQGEMTITISLADVEGGTELTAVHARLPSGLSPADNEAGWRMSLAKLAALIGDRP